MPECDPTNAPSGLRSRPSSGFSLVELLVVVSIMSLLATVGLPLAELSRQRAKEENLRRALREIRGALDSYKQLVDEGRIERPADGSGYPPSLDALTEGVKDAKTAHGTKIYVIRSLPRDPFAAAESLPAAATWELRSYASTPEEPQPGKDVFDVHSKSSAIGFNGFAYRTW